ncbi:SpoIIE family protein phosphatase [Calothrix sp. 336/3]|uniref:SpoIIE family protein phosphatase n=1 Tax=Calothrix sp. 336/3 TaxID=1337936 RepID=UPI0004E2F06A|nr:SpoIIE family protein phosphatase [Calothrix sp. 336/3]AKG23918.1 chemotaxis protein CheY [Calothrix sp. 336/3]
MTDTETPKLKLMVIDDEPDNLELLYRTFRRDFQVFKATHARTALDILEKEGEMAVIITDQRMPEMNGTEFLGLTVERFPDTIRILLTGFTDVEDLVDAINAGQVFKYITKPWKPENLKLIVDQAADTYRVVKKRIHELQRTLRRESLFNGMTTAIRGSLDYHSMLENIVDTIGKSFDASYCLIRPVDGDRLTPESFFYENSKNIYNLSIDTTPLIEKVLASHEYQISSSHHENSCHQIAIPLTYQQHLLAILYVCHQGSDRQWQEEEIQLMTGVAEQAALALSQAKLYQRLQEKQQQIHAELEVARQIQNNLLRQVLPEVPEVRIQACCYPAREVGGDFFEVFAHPKGDLWLAVGDVSGKGVPAALFMASAISVLRRELSQETPAMPNVLMQNLNHALGEDLISNNCFITLFIARYTPTTKELVYANAGHIYPIIWSPLGETISEPNYLKVRGIPLGILTQWQAKFGQVSLNSGDILLLASDGITEAMVVKTTDTSDASQGNTDCAKPSMLNSEGLWQLLKQEPKPLSLDHLLARIQADNHTQEDDQTILSLEVL